MNWRSGEKGSERCHHDDGADAERRDQPPNATGNASFNAAVTSRLTRERGSRNKNRGLKIHKVSEKMLMIEKRNRKIMKKQMIQKASEKK